MATVVLPVAIYAPNSSVSVTINSSVTSFSGVLWWVPQAGSPYMTSYSSTSGGANILVGYLRVPNTPQTYTLADNSAGTGGTTITVGVPVLDDPDITDGIGGYVRWRPRMVRLSVFADIQNSLTATGWIGGGTALLYPVDVKEFFPEFAVYAQDQVHVNTLTLDNGDPSMIEEYELGGIMSRDYRLNMAMYAQDNETGQALFSDLGDRYIGLTEIPYVPLYNYNTSPPTLIVRMEVLGFQYTRASLDVSPYEHHLFYAELLVRDFVDSNRTVMAP